MKMLMKSDFKRKSGITEKCLKGMNEFSNCILNLNTVTLGTQNLWPLLTGGRCSEVALCYKN